MSVNLHADTFIVWLLPRRVMSVGHDSGLTRHDMTTAITRDHVAAVVVGYLTAMVNVLFTSNCCV